MTEFIVEVKGLTFDETKWINDSKKFEAQTIYDAFNMGTEWIKSYGVEPGHIQSISVQRRVRLEPDNTKALQGKGPYNVVCPVCGTLFQTTHKNRKYCSAECADIHKRETLRDKYWESLLDENVEPEPEYPAPRTTFYTGE